MINVYKLPGIDGVWSLWETGQPGMVAAMPHSPETGKAHASGFRYFPAPLANRAKVTGQLKPAQERGLETLVHTTELHASKVYPGGEVIQSKGLDIGSIAQDVKRLQSEMRKVARWTGMQYPEGKGVNKPEPEPENEHESEPKPKRKRKAKPESEPEDLSDIPF